MKTDRLYTYAPLLVLLIVTVFFRLWRIGDIPLGINNDAIWEGSAAWDILQGNWRTYIPYAEAWHGEPVIRATIVFLSPFLGNTPTTIKLASSIFGILLIPVFYILLKKLFSQRLALVASWFVTTSGWHIIMSRSGWRAIVVPTVTTCVIFALHQVASTRKLFWYSISGIFLAFTLYTYDAARIIPLTIMATLIVKLITSPSFRLRHHHGIPLFFISFILIASPICLYAASNWETFVGRTSYLLVTTEVIKTHSITPLINNLTTSVGLFTQRANGNDFFVDEPLLDPPVLWLFSLGFFLTLWEFWKHKKMSFGLMLSWFFVSLIPAILSSPNGNRAIGALPAVYFFAAYATDRIAGVIQKFATPYGRTLATTFLIYVMGFTAIGTYISYMGPTRKQPRGFYPETWITSSYLKTKKIHTISMLRIIFPGRFLPMSYMKMVTRSSQAIHGSHKKNRCAR
jgi:hypothetical protein